MIAMGPQRGTLCWCANVTAVSKWRSCHVRAQCPHFKTKWSGILLGHCSLETTESSCATDQQKPGVNQWCRTSIYAWCSNTGNATTQEHAYHYVLPRLFTPGSFDGCIKLLQRLMTIWLICSPRAHTYNFRHQKKKNMIQAVTRDEWQWMSEIYIWNLDWIYVYLNTVLSGNDFNKNFTV